MIVSQFFLITNKGLLTSIMCPSEGLSDTHIYTYLKQNIFTMTMYTYLILVILAILSQ